MSDENKASRTGRFGTGICENCGDPYPKVKRYQRFCKADCRMESWHKAKGSMSENRTREIVREMVKPEALK